MLQLTMHNFGTDLPNKDILYLYVIEYSYRLEIMQKASRTSTLLLL